jgi:hypothetical protein
VIGSFSWTTIEEAYWLTHGFWHSSLIFAVLGILLSASEVTVLHLLGPVETRVKYIRYRDDSEFKRYEPLLLSCTKTLSPKQYRPRRKMVFTWQRPLMFMSYSVCAFLAGLTVLVCTPLIRGGGNWTAGHSVSRLELRAAVLLTSLDCCYVFDSICQCRDCVRVLLVLGVPLCGIGFRFKRRRQYSSDRLTRHRTSIWLDHAERAVDGQCAAARLACYRKASKAWYDVS